MKQLIENFGALGKRRLITMAGIVLAVIAASFIGLSVAMSPQYRAVATDLTASEAAEMMAALEASGFSPRVSNDGTLVSLPEQDLGRGRMALAQEGLPSSDKAGWEIFRESNGIGMNSFMQRVNKLVAMEGALGRSIESMDSVEKARVHLVLGERETFSQERPEPRASVMLSPRRGQQITRRQALAIRNLVAGGVPDIAPDNIVVLTASGETILGSETDDITAGIISARAAIEERVARNIESILSAHVGAGNIRVKVAAELTTEREIVIQESFDPDQQVARSTSALSEQSQSTDAGAGNVDVANNMPGVENGGGAGGGGEESRSKTLDETVFEIGNTRSERVVEPGSVKRLSVAVLVNDRIEGDQLTDRSPEEMETLRALVRSAAGIDPSRGDEVTVQSLEFVDSIDMLEDVETGGIGDILARNSGTLIRGGFVLLALAMILLFGVRPVLARMREISPAEPMPETAVDLADVAEAQPEDTTGGDGAGARETRSASDPVGEDEYVSLASVSGDVMRRYIEDLSGIVDGNREDAIRVLRVWIHQKG